ncbi:lipocalin family protein [Maribacter aestuarii]|uniref:lipocalin family protein n=1 Tax=Maribacter aestuarii TaxID=1130723 RepID=UPI00248AFF1A|nr:lipocalin family protein [Maribacter aestuarii]
MKTNTILATLTFSLFLFASCSPKLVGTWNVEKYERSTPGEQGMSVSNIGTITFNKNGTGTKNLDYSLLGVSKKDATPFTWSTTEQFITIEGDESEFTKTWIYIENKSDYQKWQSTDGANNVQTLELVKE